MSYLFVIDITHESAPKNNKKANKRLSLWHWTPRQIRWKKLKRIRFGALEVETRFWVFRLIMRLEIPCPFQGQNCFYCHNFRFNKFFDFFSFFGTKYIFLFQSLKNLRRSMNRRFVKGPHARTVVPHICTLNLALHSPIQSVSMCSSSKSRSRITSKNHWEKVFLLSFDICRLILPFTRFSSDFSTLSFPLEFFEKVNLISV